MDTSNMLIIAVAVLALIIIVAGIVMLNRSPQRAARGPAPESAAPSGTAAEAPHTPTPGAQHSSGGVAPSPRASVADRDYITTVTGMEIEGPRSVRFFGTTEDGRPPLSAWRLAEYFAIALKSYATIGTAPGLSIDPTPEQIQQGMDMTGDMNVRYIGPCENTALGMLAFAADRRMKCLGHGEDNLTGVPVGLSVQGYRSIMDMSFDEDEDVPARTRHRLWIEPAAARLSVVSDRRTVNVDVDMQISVKRQAVNSAGELVDVEAQADQHTARFAQLMTTRYDDFARQDPTFAEMRAASSVIAVAKLALERQRSADPSDDLPIDFEWWRDSFPVRALRTPKTTPVGAVEREEKREVPGGWETRWVKLSGGVSLEPVSFEARRPAEGTGNQPGKRASVSIGENETQAAERASIEDVVGLSCHFNSNTRKWELTSEHGDQILTLPARFADAPVTLGGSGDRAGADVISSLAHQAGGSARPVVLYCKDKPAEKAVHLRQRMQGDMVMLSAQDQQLARQNREKLAKIAANPRNVEVVLNRASLDPKQRELFNSYDFDCRAFPMEGWHESVVNVGSDADTVIVAGECGKLLGPDRGPLAADIEAARQQGLLAGKCVLLIVCGSQETSEFIASLFRNPDLAPAAVLAPLGPVEVELVKPIMEGLSHVLDRSPNIEPYLLFDEVVRVLERTHPELDAQTWKRIRALLRSIGIQISECPRGGAFLDRIA